MGVELPLLPLLPLLRLLEKAVMWKRPESDLAITSMVHTSLEVWCASHFCLQDHLVLDLTSLSALPGIPVVTQRAMAPRPTGPQYTSCGNTEATNTCKGMNDDVSVTGSIGCCLLMRAQHLVSSLGPTPGCVAKHSTFLPASRRRRCSS